MARGVIAQHCLDDTFYVLDLGRLQRLHQAWSQLLPRVTPFYAGKLAQQLVGAHSGLQQASAGHHSRQQSSSASCALSAQVVQQHGRLSGSCCAWRTSGLPDVPHDAAVKCNPDRAMLAMLAAQGTGFDCASAAEIDLVMGLGVPANRIIYAHPCKPMSHIRHAAQVWLPLCHCTLPECEAGCRLDLLAQTACPAKQCASCCKLSAPHAATAW